MLLVLHDRHAHALLPQQARAPTETAFFAGTAESERAYIREKSLEGQASALERGRHGARPRVVDDDMAAYARSLRANGVPVPQIAQELVITSG